MTRLRLHAMLIVMFLATSAFAAEQAQHRVRALKITVLSTMLADAGIGEWGFAALVEVDGKRILFDTGARPETVLANAREMRVDLANVEDLVISHNHGDHTGGLLTLRRELQKQNPKALSKTHVGDGIFLSRLAPNGRDTNGLLPFKADYEATGGQFFVYTEPTELWPGVWITGPVPRVHPEKNYPTGLMLKSSSGDVEDTVPEDSSLVFNTEDGLVVLSGCGHSGVINTVEYARKSVASSPILAVVGGLHLFAASDDSLAWTSEKLKAVGLRNLLAAHCTGIEATFRLRQLAGLDRKSAVVSAVGSSFTLGKGIDPRALAK